MVARRHRLKTGASLVICHHFLAITASLPSSLPLLTENCRQRNTDGHGQTAIAPDRSEKRLDTETPNQVSCRRQLGCYILLRLRVGSATDDRWMQPEGLGGVVKEPLINS